MRERATESLIRARLQATDSESDAAFTCVFVRVSPTPLTAHQAKPLLHPRSQSSFTDEEQKAQDSLTLACGHQRLSPTHAHSQARTRI